MAFTDIRKIDAIESLPHSWRPYAYLMRLDRPVGWWLLLLPAWWGLTLGYGGFGGLDARSGYLIVLFLLGAIIMRGAGCVINDLWDRKLDQKVERTQNRPLASGAIQPWQALVFLAVLLMAGLAILLQMSTMTIVLGLLSLPLIAIYPLMKRITFWPQLVLGMTFNFGALMGWAAATQSLHIPAFTLYFGALLWTMGYDTIYAHQDKDDDALVGAKSTALKFGSQSKIWVGGFYCIAWLFFTITTYLTVDSLPALSLLAFPALHMGWQILRWDMDDQENCLHIFKSNRDFGLLILGIFMVAPLF